MANEMSMLEDHTFMRMVDMWEQLTRLDNDIKEVTGTGKYICFLV